MRQVENGSQRGKYSNNDDNNHSNNCNLALEQCVCVCV